MTQLLVSVRNLAEARIAQQAGAHLIDLKEPSLGSLGAVDAQVAAEVALTLRGRVPLSMALGELCDLQQHWRIPIPPGIDFAKLGLAGCTRRADWAGDWARWMETLPGGTSAVAVVYADWRQVLAPPPEQVVRHARALGCRALLVDTCDKSGPSLTEQWTTRQLRQMMELASAAGMMTVLAGSLTPETIPRVLPLAPDYVAVRGAACAGSRGGQIDRSRVCALVEVLLSRK